MTPETAKILSLLMAGVLSFAYWLAARPRPQRGASGDRWPRRLRIVSTVVLACTAVFSVGTYFKWRVDRFTTVTNASDVFHYYLVGKYFDEIGYHGLYDCAVVADGESPEGRQLFRDVHALRNLETYGWQSRADVLARAEECRGRFSPERWGRFKEDVRVLGGRVAKKLRSWMLQDRGANATPVWQLWGGTLAQLVPATQVKLACLADVLLMIAAFVWVWRAFGGVPALFALIFVTSCFSTRWPVIGTALGRYDWVATLIMGVCALRQGRMAAAGGILAFATLSRVYPAFFVATLGLKALGNVIVHRRLDRAHLRFGVAFVIACLGLLAAAASLYGPHRIGECVAKLRRHTDPSTISRQRVGLPIAAAWRGEWGNESLPSTYARDRRDLVAKQRRYVQAVGVAAAVVIAFAVRRVSDTRAAMLGFSLLCFSAAASYYYWVMLVVPFLGCVRSPRSSGNLAAIWLLLLSQAVAHLQQAIGLSRYLLTLTLSVSICLCGLYLIALAALKSHRQRAATLRPRTP